MLHYVIAIEILLLILVIAYFSGKAGR